MRLPLMTNVDTLLQCIRQRMIQARPNVAVSVNQEMVQTYWETGRSIVEACGEEARADYGSTTKREVGAQKIHRIRYAHFISFLWHHCSHVHGNWRKA